MEKDGAFDQVDLEGSSKGSPDTLDNIAALGLSFNADNIQVENAGRRRFSLEDVGDFVDRSLPLESDLPFNKWVRKLEQRATRMRKTASCEIDGSVLRKELFDSSPPGKGSTHKKSLSGSSFGFVTAIKSASISLASISFAPPSRKTGILSRHRRTDRSSKTSQQGRFSEDSSSIARGTGIDQAVTDRLLQRRRIVEELISTEENYIADVSFLTNASRSRVTPELSLVLILTDIRDPTSFHPRNFVAPQSINQ